MSKKKEVYYICGTCADVHDGEWPDGHCATFHSAICNSCGKAAALASVDDWNWPHGKPKNWVGAGRD